MILYFSTTGNGKYISEQIAERTNETCVGCGVCAKKCPVEAIQMEEGYPVWKSEECEMCLGCLHRCPKFAIIYGNDKTVRHGRYKNPYTRI